MTLAEARRMLDCKTNYMLSKATGIPEYKLSRWKKRNNRIPEEFRGLIQAAATSASTDQTASPKPSKAA